MTKVSVTITPRTSSNLPINVWDEIKHQICLDMRHTTANACTSNCNAHRESSFQPSRVTTSIQCHQHPTVMYIWHRSRNEYSRQLSSLPQFFDNWNSIVGKSRRNSELEMGMKTMDISTSPLHTGLTSTPSTSEYVHALSIFWSDCKCSVYCFNSWQARPSISICNTLVEDVNSECIYPV